MRTVREECLDQILILNEPHLKRVLKTYDDYYNRRRPHQGIRQQSPIPRTPQNTSGKVRNRKVLGGIINDYYRSVGYDPDTVQRIGLHFELYFLNMPQDYWLLSILEECRIMINPQSINIPEIPHPEKD